MSGSSPPAPLSVFFRNFSNLAWRPFKSRKRFSRRTAWRREEDTEGQHLSQPWSWRAENRACCSESWPSLSQYPDTPQEDTEHKTGTTCSALVPESRPTATIALVGQNSEIIQFFTGLCKSLVGGCPGEGVNRLISGVLWGRLLRGRGCGWVGRCWRGN